MSKDTFYFSHDYNSRADDKIKSLIRKHGVTGYGIFWCIIEDLYNNANALQLDYDGIAYDLRTDCDIIKSIINDFDLFVIEGSYFGSTSVERRLDERNDKSAKASRSAFARWNRAKEDANAMRTQCDGNAINKGKERKELKKKFIAPTLEEIKSFFKEKGYSEESAIKAFNHYNYADWKDTSGKQVLNWKQKMNTVWFKPENKIQQSSRTNFITHQGREII
jgi:hypothetical protein